jgi:hypothetical protein
MAFGLALARVQFGGEGGRYLDRRAAYFAVTLRKMSAADREQRLLGRHGNEQSRAGSELLDVDVACNLTRRNGTKRLAGYGRFGCHGAKRLGSIDCSTRASSSASRRKMVSRSDAEGATPMEPMKEAPGIRTPGICSLVAQLPAMSHLVMCGRPRSRSSLDGARRSLPMVELDAASRSSERRGSAPRRRCSKDAGNCSCSSTRGTTVATVSCVVELGVMRPEPAHGLIADPSAEHNGSLYDPSISDDVGSSKVARRVLDSCG